MPLQCLHSHAISPQINHYQFSKLFLPGQGLEHLQVSQYPLQNVAPDFYTWACWVAIWLKERAPVRMEDWENVKSPKQRLQGDIGKGSHWRWYSIGGQNKQANTSPKQKRKTKESKPLLGLVTHRTEGGSPPSTRTSVWSLLLFQIVYFYYCS